MLKAADQKGCLTRDTVTAEFTIIILCLGHSVSRHTSERVCILPDNVT